LIKTSKQEQPEEIKEEEEVTKGDEVEDLLKELAEKLKGSRKQANCIY